MFEDTFVSIKHPLRCLCVYIYIYFGTKKGELTVPQKYWFQLDTGT